MKIYLKTENGNYTNAAIQILRKHSSEGLSDLKNKLINKLPLLYFDTIEDDMAKVNDVIDELEKSGIQLAFYEIGKEERKIDKSILQNLFQRAKEISEQIEREIEIETTEIVVVVDKTFNGGHSHQLLYEDEFKVYYLFDYSVKLLDFIKQTQNYENIEYYKRDRGDENKQGWEFISTNEIHSLMGF
jgi:hypothetical protein